MILASFLMTAVMPKSRVVIISPQESALDYSNSLGNSDLPPTGKKSERKTYLINDGPYARQEIAGVLPFVESTKVEFVVRFNEDKTITAWRPDGTLIQGVKMPLEKFLPAFDYSPYGDTIVVWSQSTFSPYQNVLHSEPEHIHITEERYFESFLFAYATVASFWEGKSYVVWSDFEKPKSAMINVPFQIDFCHESVGSLPLRVGASCIVDGSNFEILNLRDVVGDGTKAIVDIRQHPELPKRQFLTMPEVDWRDQIAKYGMPSLTAKTRNPHFELGYWGEKVAGEDMMYSASGEIPFDHWKRIRIDKLIHLTGYFGQIAMRPKITLVKPGRRAAQAVDLHLRAIWYQAPMSCRYIPGYDEEPETMPARKYKVACGGSEYIILNRHFGASKSHFSHEVYKVNGKEREADLVDVWVPGNFDQERFTVDEKTHTLRCEGRMLNVRHSPKWELLGAYQDGKVIP